MNYIDDLDKCINILEETLAEVEKCYKNGWFTSVSIHKLRLDCTLKSVRFCVRCAKRKAEKKEISPVEFTCEGGCIRPGIYDKFKECNEKLWYIFHWSRRKDPRYDSETGLFLGNDTSFWEQLKDENSKE